MNISTIQPPPLPEVTWTTGNAQEKDADFLKLRLLNKRTRARISHHPLDLNVHEGKGAYLVVSNLKGWFAAIARNAQGQSQLVFSSLKDLREFILSSKVEGEDDFVPKRVVRMAAPPVHLALALHDERLIAGFVDGSISIYSTPTVFTPGEGDIEPLRTFPPSPPGPLRQILGNPGDLPELVAVRRDAESGAEGISVEILDVKELQSLGGWRTGGIAGSVPVSIAWSAKGKQLALGLKSGDIVTYSPTDTNSVKLHVPKPPSLGDFSVASVLWLSNQAFYGIYIPAADRSPEAPQKHILTQYDPKTNSASQTELETPYYASPALRPPGAFMVVMRNWNPTKVLLFVGDSTSSDIGLIGSVTESDNEETWCNLTLEETSTPSVPLDKDAEDTIPLALDVDLTSGQDEQAASASPILYLYASDGTFQAWFISNDKGGPYPGMVTPSPVTASPGGQPSQSVDKLPAATPFSQPPANPATFTSKPFGGTTPAFGQTSGSGFGGLLTQPEHTKTTFGQTNILAPAGSSGFGQQSAPAFGQKTDASTFGGTATLAFGQGPASGFGAFGSAGPPKFGSTGFGYGNANSSAPGTIATPTEAPAADAASPEAEMSDADGGGAGKLDGLSLGETTDTNKSEDKTANSMFGSFAKPTAPQQSTAGFGSTSPATSFGVFGNVQGSGFLKPASGFGAFLKPAESQFAPKDSSSDKETRTSPAFGSSGFGMTGFGTARPHSGYGQPAFGQSSFGSSTAFGKPSSFGSSLPLTSSSNGDSTSVGFGAFAGVSKSFGSFTQGDSASVGQHAQSVPSKLSEAPSITMASSTEDSGKGSVPSSATESKSTSTFSAPTNATSGFDSTKSSTSPLVTEAQTSNMLPGGPSGESTSGDSGSRTLSPSSQDQKQSTFSTPVARGQSPVSSPEGTPTPQRKSGPASIKDDSFVDSGDESVTSPTTETSTTPFGTPAASIFRTSGTVPSGGAFGNLTATPSAFKPAEGFGAFGASLKTSSSSPFANPKPISVNAFSAPAKPVSAFGAGGSGPSGAFGSSPDSTTPKFGTPSTPTASNIFGKSSFGTPATPTPVSTTPLTTPVPNAFTTYSGTGGFSAFAKAGKPSSFSDLLKSQKDGENSTSTSAKGAGSSKEIKDVDASFVTVSKPEEVDHDNLPPTPSTHGTFDEEEQNLDDEGDEEEHDDDASSFLSESFSEEPDEEEEEESEDVEEGEEDSENEDSEEEPEEDDEEALSRAKTQSPTAIPLPSTPEPRESTPKPAPSDEKKGHESQDDLSAGVGKSEGTMPKPVFSKPAPSTSTKPTSETVVVQVPGDNASVKGSVPPKPPLSAFTKPETSAIPTLFGKQVPTAGMPAAGSSKANSPSPPLFTPESVGAPAAKPGQRVLSPSVEAESMTPPGSPGQQEEQSPFPAPKPVGPASSTGFGGFGLPGSRPTRSSPLAATPLAGEENKASPGNQASQTTAPVPKPRPASPRTPFGQVPGATGQQKLPVPIFPKPEEPRRQSPTSFSAGASTLPLKPTQFVAPAQGTATSSSVFRPPFSSAQNSSVSSPNAPFIMPPLAPAGPDGKPASGLGNAADITDFRGGGAPAQQFSQPSVQPPPPVQTTFESSMQRECQNLYLTMEEELEQLAKMSKAALAMKTSWGRPTGMTHSKETLGDRTKWSFGDLEAFSKVIEDVENDVLAVYRLKDEFLPLIREAESALLKAETRKEEIIRISKAKTEPEFARILKARTLDPDASETQSQLRRQIRLINDRVEQLEVHLKSCKKRLEEHRKGKSSIKAPSLDTVTRIYRNIDVAIEAESEQIETLASRIAKLNIDDLDMALHGTPSPRRRRIENGNRSLSHSDDQDGDREPTSRPQVTPSIAASTAAALNAERSAMRLKNALLNARKTPLLNTQASQPGRRVLTLDDLTRQSSGIGNASTLSGPPAELDLSSDPLGAPEQDTGSESQRRTLRHFAHAKPVKLGKTQSPVPSSIAAFSWGPLPKVNPVSSLPFEIKPVFDSKKPVP
ncbi:hypothetical protein A7U60_g7585 [Sanghuangporus baumii]|uniref:Nucleoporin Nup159/Nup146 N-terminal domain-containing protein n=1 Tax=Sanghuangporus baumii TaxID=108892 RepID=A0A9Q5HSU9_SANBA|nr:hypothetical protein A7U60_g7585 [Sanghuangporus baumii]